MTRTIRVALGTFIGGFLIEAGTEIYQLLSYGVREPGWIGLYYVGLAATGVGFYLMYRGRHEWTDEHRKNVRQGHRLLGAAIAMFVGAFLVIALLGIWRGGRNGPNPSAALAWVVGGLVTVSFGNFFLSLAILVDRITGRLGRFMAWGGFGWSLGVAVLTGYLVGGEFLSLLDEFFTNPLALAVSFAPLAFVIAPLFVSYLLFAGAYAQALHRLRKVTIPPTTGAAAPPSDRTA